MTEETMREIQKNLAAGEAAQKAGDRAGLAMAIANIFQTLPEEEIKSIFREALGMNKGAVA